MVRDIFIPATGMARDDVILESWLKQPGDRVAAGEVVAVVETSKTSLDVQADAAGVLGDHLVAEQQAVPPGTTIARLRQDGDPPPTTPPVADAPPIADAPHGRAETVAEHPRPPHRVSPRARRVAAEAAEHSISAAGTPAPEVESTGPEQGEDRFRRAVAAAVSQSWRDIPHFAVTRELHLNRLAKAYRKARIVLPELTLTDLLLRAIALAFLTTQQRTDLDIGLAVATDRGVAIPVIRNVPRLDLVELSVARAAAVLGARAGRAAADAGRPVSTLSNLGALGVDQFTGIVPTGQSNLITVGRLAERPIVRRGKIRPAMTMQVTVNADHRSWDGQDSAQLLGRLAAVTAEPALLLGFGRLTGERT